MDVFGHHYDISRSGSVKDIQILRIAQTDIRSGKAAMSKQSTIHRAMRGDI